MARPWPRSTATPRRIMAISNTPAERCSTRRSRTIAKQVNTQGEGRAVLIFNPCPGREPTSFRWIRHISPGSNISRLSMPPGAPCLIRSREKPQRPKRCSSPKKCRAWDTRNIASRPAIEQPKFSTDLTVSGLTLANSQVEVVIDPDSGNLKSLKKKGMERNFLREDNPGAALEVWEDKPAQGSAAASRRGISIWALITSWIRPKA